MPHQAAYGSFNSRFQFIWTHIKSLWDTPTWIALQTTTSWIIIASIIMQKEFNWLPSTLNKDFMLNSGMELNIKHYSVWVEVIVFLQLQLCDNMLDIHMVEGLRMAPTSPNRVRTPFQDIRNKQSLVDEHYTTTQFQFLYPNCWIVPSIADPKEVKRQRDRERYAQNKDEINKRRRETCK